MRTVLLAAAFGVMITMLLLALAYGLDALGYPNISSAIFWQNTLLQSFCPTMNIGTSEHPVYEGTPLNFLAFIASIPLGFLIYGVAAYVVLHSRRRGHLI